MTYKCEIEERKAQDVLSVRIKTSVQDLPKVMGKIYGNIAQYLGKIGEFPAGPPFAAYYNMDMQNLDIEIGFPISKKLPNKEDIKTREIPSGKFATCLYTGPYSEIEPAYNELFQWIIDNGYEATGIAYEVYLDDPAQTPPEELKTQIMFLLK